MKRDWDVIREVLIEVEPSAQGLICRWHPTSARCVSCGGEAHLWNGEGRRA